jgi:hypothetical protein
MKGREGSGKDVDRIGTIPSQPGKGSWDIGQG